MGCGCSMADGGSSNAHDPKAGGKDKKIANRENKDFQQTMAFLSKVQLFMGLPQDVYPLLAQACEPAEFKKGDVIIRQGEAGSEFFVIKKGEALVTVQVGSEPPNQVAKLKDGDYFGEHALLRDEPRTATINASTTLKTLKIRREKFRELELNEKLHFANRKAVGAGGARTLVTKEPSPKTPQERKLIADALKKNGNLQTMVSLRDDSRVNSMIDIAWKETIPEGTELITEGDLIADYFYVVQEGAFEVFVAGRRETTVDPVSAERAMTKGESKFVSNILAGDSFGELALLYLEPRAATVKAKEDSVVWVFDRQNFKKILMKAPSETINEYVKLLGGVELLHPLLKEERMAMANALVEMHFADGEVILQQGEPGSTFFILYEGEVAVMKDGVEQTKLLAARQGSAEFFGERALLTQEPRAATVVVTSRSAKVLALDRDSFQLLLGPLEDILSRGSQGESKLGAGRAAKAAGANWGSQRILRKDLQRIGLLGCGGFGVVDLVEHKTTRECYAMKALSKGYIMKTGMQESVVSEKTILMMTNSPFIIKLHETYNGQQTLYFLLEPAMGGELYATYNRKGFHGSEKHARFYIAGTILGFEHLHQRRIIYRDLKPENLLLNEQGQLKITDMGLAKFVIGKTYTTCGTPDYFAPEVIASTGHTNAVDWWTLGILAFELMSGHPPFESPYHMQIYNKVTQGINKVVFPQKCQGAVGDLIRSLLQAEPSERLPMRPGGVQNIKDHRWFKMFDWRAFTDLKMEAPYVPKVRSKTDISNFTARSEDQPRKLDYKDDGSDWDKDFATSI